VRASSRAPRSSPSSRLSWASPSRSQSSSRVGRHSLRPHASPLSVLFVRCIATRAAYMPVICPLLGLLLGCSMPATCRITPVVCRLYGRKSSETADERKRWDEADARKAKRIERRKLRKGVDQKAQLHATTSVCPVLLLYPVISPLHGRYMTVTWPLYDHFMPAL
jgi:hypothetical protein